MKIRTVEVRVVKAPLEAAYRAGGREAGANWHVLARITTEDGVTGFGHIVSLNGMFIGAAAAATRELAPLLTGLRVDQPEAVWRKMARAGDWIGPGGLPHHAICPLDIAIWDAFGKTPGVPVSRLLGGMRDRIPAYASDGFWCSLSLDDLAASARRAADAGFRALKLRVGNERHPAGEVARVRAARESHVRGQGVAIVLARWRAKPPARMSPSWWTRPRPGAWIAPSAPAARYRRRA